MSNHQFGHVVFAEQAGSIAESEGFAPLPKGDYVMKLVDLEAKESQHKTSKFIAATFEIAPENGSHVGQKIWHNFTYQNANQKAVNIGLGQLKTFCRITRGELLDHEAFTMDHLVQALGVPFVASLKPRENFNEISVFKMKFDSFNQQGNQAPQYSNTSTTPQFNTQNGYDTSGKGNAYLNGNQAAATKPQ